MTKVKLASADGLYVLIAKGHATGSPEVCAAVSCLLYTLAGWLKNRKGEKRPCVCNMSEAHANIIWDGEGAETAFEIMMIGFLQLAKAFPKYICVEIE